MTRPILSYKFLALALSLFQASLVVGQSDNSSSDVADSQYWHERYHGESFALVIFGVGLTSVSRNFEHGRLWSVDNKEKSCTVTSATDSPTPLQNVYSSCFTGDYATLCPLHTFTQASLNKAYPDSTEVPVRSFYPAKPLIKG